jgi:hypothetical protein
MRTSILWFSLLIVVIGSSAWWVSHSNTALERQIQQLAAAVGQQKDTGRPSGVCAASVDGDILRSEARRAFESLCKGALDSKPEERAVLEAKQDLNSEDTAPTPSPAAIKAFDDSTKLIEHGLARRTWGEDELSQLRILLPNLDGQSRDDIMHRLVQAANEGKLAVDTPRGQLF